MAQLVVNADHVKPGDVIPMWGEVEASWTLYSNEYDGSRWRSVAKEVRYAIVGSDVFAVYPVRGRLAVIR